MSGWFSEGMRQSTILKALLDSGNLLDRVMRKTIEKIITGIAAQPAFSEKEASRSQALLVLVQKVLGNAIADRVFAVMQKEKCSVSEALIKEKLLTPERVAALFDLKTLATPGENTRLIRSLRSSLDA